MAVAPGPASGADGPAQEQRVKARATADASCIHEDSLNEDSPDEDSPDEDNGRLFNGHPSHRSGRLLQF